MYLAGGQVISGQQQPPDAQDHPVVLLPKLRVSDRHLRDKLLLVLELTISTRFRLVTSRP
jgi:hypothetical protein